MGLEGATACVIFLALQIVMLSRVRFTPRGFATREKTPYLPLGIQPGVQPPDPACLPSLPESRHVEAIVLETRTGKLFNKSDREIV